MAKTQLSDVRKRLTAFSRNFANAKDEQQEAIRFWEHFYACFGIAQHEATIYYEKKVRMLGGELGRIDSFIPGLLIVEHKSRGKDLDSAYEQASDYFLALKQNERPKYIIVSDFARIRLYDLTKKEVFECTLAELPSKASWFKFLITRETIEIVEETPINRNAAYAISKLHESLTRDKFIGEDLEIFLTRLLFCMFADDTGIFDDEHVFRRLVQETNENGEDLGSRLTALFETLNTPYQERQTTLSETLTAFPYVNGELFSKRTRIPVFDNVQRKALIDCAVLDWSLISPAIFGAMFQGVLEEHSPDLRRQATRRELGAHYTSERNILKVINPLFMDDLRKRLAACANSKAKLQELYDELPNLHFLDPACGCGNFLVIAYRELRRFEFELIKKLFRFEHVKGLLDVSTLCRVKLNQFYGIEIDEAATHIARVALYITDHQLNLEASRLFGETRASIPLVHSPHIKNGNALTTDWETVIPQSQCRYIVSNPPFVGSKHLTRQQALEIQNVFDSTKGSGVLDYVSGWYAKAAHFIQNTNIEAAFVSTNSITQGEQAGILWEWIFARKIEINFAYRNFVWANEGKANAAVHCVIIGFSQVKRDEKCIYSHDKNEFAEPLRKAVSNINGYLIDARSVVVRSRSKPLCAVIELGIGNKPVDNGNYLFSEEEKESFIKKEPKSASLFRRWLGAKEFLNDIKRWCLLVKECNPVELRAMPLVLERIERVREFRLTSKSSPTIKLAETPMKFHVENFPYIPFLIIPRHSSERRKYLPIGFMEEDAIVGDANLILKDATLYEFSILSSALHMAWLRTICGRIKSDFRYSAGVVYNNFIWPEDVNEEMHSKIKDSAKAILDARLNFPKASLADLYDPIVMPEELLIAHNKNDKIIDKVYGYAGANSDFERAEFLFKLYEKATISSV